MMEHAHQKVTASHLRRTAYLYVRQSTIRQVFENTESTQRQYALRQRAAALGWPDERIVTIDCDLGQSGSSAVDRAGFQQLVAEVGMGRAGIVLGLEVSRLARNSLDWHRLLEICALTDTLILDEDGIYDPAHFNDRLLLGLKGTMSEAELHVLRARLQGGVRSKARRGELMCPLPVGLEYDPDGQVVLDPDAQVQQSLRHLFETFRRRGSVRSTVKAFSEEGLLFPQRVRTGSRRGDLLWAELDYSRAINTLHNPRYTGAFVYGRTRTRKRPDGSVTRQTLPQGEWLVLLPDAHAGYISWAEYEENQRRLRDNAPHDGADRRQSPPREGPALLQGIALCGLCGQRMTVRYRSRQGCTVPQYLCQNRAFQRAEPMCQSIPGATIDEAIGSLLLETVTPLALDVALAVQEELRLRAEEADALRRQRVERTRYEAELARRRFMRVDPDNRLAADALEHDWNDKLHALNEAQQEYERQCQRDDLSMDEEHRARIAALATDFPALWRDDRTPDRERKRMVRLLLEDVTLIKDEQITMHVRFKGGATRTLTLPRPLNAWQLRQTNPAVVAQIDELLDAHTDGEIAAILNERGYTSGSGKALNSTTVAWLERTYGLKSRYERLSELGLLTQQEMAHKLGVCPHTVRAWRDHGLLTAYRYNDNNECLYEDPGPNPPTKAQGRKFALRSCSSPDFNPTGTNEVQCDA